MQLAQWASDLEARQDEYWGQVLPRTRTLFSDLFDRLGGAGGVLRSSGLFEARSEFALFEQELRHHMQTEEAVLYPLCGYLGQGATMALPNAAALWSSLLEEHSSISERVQAFRRSVHLAMVPAQFSPLWFQLQDVANALSRMWQEHVEEQEKLLLPRVPSSGGQVVRTRAASRTTSPHALAGQC